MPDSTVPIQLADRSYDVIIGRGLLARIGEHASRLALPRRCAVITDSLVEPLYGKIVSRSLRENGMEPTIVPVPAGEPSKSLSAVESVCRAMLRAGLDRQSFAVALGGGVVGDLAGFAASIFLRGIPCIQAPTTLLAQVDSSVGGKTGVNTPEGKNLIGTFAQPALVLADVDTLTTLPKRVFAEGFAEIIKHAAIRDASLFNAIQEIADGRGDLAALIRRNVEIKARIVEQDEHETTGERALLNFGHTIGHAIEASVPYGELLHGEAISLGMTAAAMLSCEIAGLEPTAAAKIIDLLKRLGLPTRLSDALKDEAILQRFRHDKKFSEGKIRFVLLRSLGDAFVSHDVTELHIAGAIRDLRA